MQSYKHGPRHDQQRHRGNRNPSDVPRGKVPPQVDVILPVSGVGAKENAGRVSNLKLLLSKVGDDILVLSEALDIPQMRLQSFLDGREVVSNQHAFHLELGLGVDQGWLDQRHVEADISQHTLDILHGKAISEYEAELQQNDKLHELKGQDIMNASATVATAAIQKASAAPIKTGTTATEKASEEAIVTRIANLTVLTEPRGAKSRLARTLGVSESIVSFLFNRKKEFTNAFTRDLEQKLGLAANWMDSPQTSVPTAAIEILEKAAPDRSQKTAPKLTKKGFGGTTNATTNLTLPPLRLSASAGDADTGSVAPVRSAGHPPKATTEAHSGLPGPSAKAVRKNPSKDEAPAEQTVGINPFDAAHQAQAIHPSQDKSQDAAFQAQPQAEASTAKAAHVEPVQKPVAEAAKPVAAAAPAQAEQKPAAQAVPSAQAAPAPARQKIPTAPRITAVANDEAIDPSMVSAIDGMNLQPITAALLKTLSMQALGGKFSEKEAMKLLGQYADL